MLKYHKILGQLSQASNADYTHYLTLGSHHTNINLQQLLCLSFVVMHPGARLNVSKQKLQHDADSIVIPLQGAIKVNQTVAQVNTVYHNALNISELSGKQAQFLYIRCINPQQQSQQKLEHQHIGEQAISLSSSLRIGLLHLSKDKSIYINASNKNVVMWIRTGKMIIQQTKQKLQSHECLYSKFNFGPIHALEDSAIYLIELGTNTVDKQKSTVVPSIGSQQKSQ